MEDSADMELGAAYDKAADNTPLPVDSPAAHKLGLEGLNERLERAGEESSEMDAQLDAIWEREQAKAGAPPMPEGFVEEHGGDPVEAASAWLALNKGTRGDFAKATKDFSDLQRAARAAGIEVKTASDLLAFQTLEAQKQQQAQQQPDPQTAQFFQRFAPGARTPAEAVQQIMPVAEHYQRLDAHISQYGARGWVDILRGYGVLDEVAHLLTGGPAATADTPLQLAEAKVAVWAEGKADIEDVAPAMIALSRQDRFKQRKGETQLDWWNRLYARASADTKRKGRGKKGGIDKTLDELGARHFPGEAA